VTEHLLRLKPPPPHTTDFYETMIVAKMSANKTNINAFIVLDEQRSDDVVEERRYKEIT
jgi:hypothetical protein